jgi:hypothetical protein
MTIQCRECRDGLEHCHGTVILHVGFGAECTEPGCERPEVAHAYRLDCEHVGCRCAGTPAVTQAVAS